MSIKQSLENRKQLEKDTQEILDNVFEKLSVQKISNINALYSMDGRSLASKIKTYCGDNKLEAIDKIMFVRSIFNETAKITGRTHISLREAIKIIDRLNGAS